MDTRPREDQTLRSNLSLRTDVQTDRQTTDRLNYTNYNQSCCYSGCENNQAKVLVATKDIQLETHAKFQLPDNTTRKEGL